MQTEGDRHRYNILQIFFIVHGWPFTFSVYEGTDGISQNSTEAKFFYALLYTTEFIHEKKLSL